MTKSVTKIILVVVAILVVAWWGVPAYRQASADATVRELCAKDGGMKVYEMVKLPAKRFDESGSVTFESRLLPPLKQNAKGNDDFFYTWETTWLIPETSVGALAMWRDHQKLFRVVDQKLLGEAIGYSRRGGDPIGPWHPSSFGCPEHADITALVRQIFVQQK